METTCPVCGGRARLVRQPDVYQCPQCGELFIDEVASVPLIDPAPPNREARQDSPFFILFAVAFYFFVFGVAAGVIALFVLSLPAP